MKTHPNIIQGTDEWHALRALNFTASELGAWALEPVRVTLTVEEIKAHLDDAGITRKGITKRDELLDLLPDAESFSELTDGARTAILRKIKQGKLAALRQRAELTGHDEIWMDREVEIAAKEAASFERNVAVKYGNLLEPYARQYYEARTGFVVDQVGFVEHSFGGFGCSPDGLISDTHGLEIKCPLPETHLEWLLDGVLPYQHKLQVHASMAVTGLDRWDFLSYCPGDAALLVTVNRDDFTEQLERGLRTLVSEKAKMKSRIAAIWAKSNQPKK